jgi:microcystin-dependent protein
MSDYFIGEIRLVSFNFAPRNWAQCNGQILPINQNQALFALLGTTFGGNGQTTFALPDLRDKVPIHVGNGHVLGEHAGEQFHTLTVSELPSHLHLFTTANHAVVSATAKADNASPAGRYWANNGKNAYSNSAGNATMASGTVGNSGGSQPHTNLQPLLTLNYCIALVGIFPQ